MPSFRLCSIALLSTAFASNITLFPDGAGLATPSLELLEVP